MPLPPAIVYVVEHGTAVAPYTLIVHWTGPDAISDLVLDLVVEETPSHLTRPLDEVTGDGTPPELFDGREL